MSVENNSRVLDWMCHARNAEKWCIIEVFDEYFVVDRSRHEYDLEPRVMYH